MASMARSLSLRSATAIASSSAKTVVAAAVNVHAVTIELVTTLTEITIELTGGDDVWGNSVPVCSASRKCHLFAAELAASPRSPSARFP